LIATVIVIVIVTDRLRLRCLVSVSLN